MKDSKKCECGDKAWFEVDNQAWCSECYAELKKDREIIKCASCDEDHMRDKLEYDPIDDELKCDECLHGFSIENLIVDYGMSIRGF